MLKNGYTPYSAVKPNKLLNYYKQFKHHRVVINMGGSGSYGDFKLNANLFYLVPEFDKYYEEVDSDHVEKVTKSFINNDVEASIKLLMVFRYLRIEGLQNEIENSLIPTLQNRFNEIEKTDTLGKLFDIYHERDMHDAKYGHTVIHPDRKILLAKLANHPNFEKLLIEYQGYVDVAREHLKDKIVPNWEKTLAIIAKIEPVE